MESLPDLIAKFPRWAQWTLAVFVAAATLSELWTRVTQGWRWLMSKLWPSRVERPWVGAATPLLQGETQLLDLSRTDENNAWRRDRPNWTHGREMRGGDTYTLMFTDKPRVVCRLRLRSEGYRFPISCAIRTESDGKWSKKADLHWDEPTITFEFAPPRKIEAIEIEIVTPRTEPKGGPRELPPAWSIYDIQVQEVRLFGRWWKNWIA